VKSEIVKSSQMEINSAISLQQKNRKLQIQIDGLKVKMYKLETKMLKQEQKIIKLQMENEKLKKEKHPVSLVIEK
jgi:hypothetical protein